MVNNAVAGGEESKQKFVKGIRNISETQHLMSMHGWL